MNGLNILGLIMLSMAGLGLLAVTRLATPSWKQWGFTWLIIVGILAFILTAIFLTTGGSK